MVPLDATVSRSAGVIGDVRRSELRVDRRTGVGARSHSWLPPRWPGGRQVHLNAKSGVNAAVKVPALAPGMAAGADSIADMDLLRHGGMDRLFTGIRAPSTLGTFLRAITFGHIRPAGVRRRGLPHRPGPENAAAARRRSGHLPRPGRHDPGRAEMQAVRAEHTAALAAKDAEAAQLRQELESAQ